VHLLASIPSPGSNAIHIGSLQLRAYGLMIAFGVLAAVWLAQKRFVQLGVGTAEDVAHIATWAVPAGVIGARAYHVITDWNLFSDDPLRALRIWEGGLGIPGGLLAGVLVGLWRTKIRVGRLGPALTAGAPAIPLAQAIGRLGNWWNQELFGRPTTLPWGLEIDVQHRPARYADVATFHPTFLYECLWNAALCVALIVIGKRFALRPGRLFALYLCGYSLARFFIEGLRVDPAKSFGGLRLNQWTALVVFTSAFGFLVVDRLRHGPYRPLAEPVHTGSRDVSA
jgi:prolipoprotein diacylglyceryl transferase